jgi:hypothetical protein
MEWSAPVNTCVLDPSSNRTVPECSCGWPQTCCRVMYPQWHPDESPESASNNIGAWRD